MSTSTTSRCKIFYRPVDKLSLSSGPSRNERSCSPPKTLSSMTHPHVKTPTTNEDPRVQYQPITNTSFPTVKTSFLDYLSDGVLVLLIFLCIITFIGLIFIIISAVNNPICVQNQHSKANKEPSEEVKITKVNMTGTFQLFITSNYAHYLQALELPRIAASQIEKLKSENISINENEKEGLTTITTITPWMTKTISFHFDEYFNVSYGEDKTKGTLSYFCTKPKINTINCNSVESRRGWKIMFDYIFTEKYLINKSYFISKNVGMTKKYRRLDV